MKNLKRALCLALSSVMLMGMMVVGSGASYNDVTAEHNVEAIEVLEAMGVMKGTGNGFSPDAKVTRQEMAVIMCNVLDLTVSSYKGTTSFTDVDSWALPYVEACYTNGIISGYSATEFGGKDAVTTGQAALMLMKALGYFQEAGDFGQDWLVATTKQGAIIDLFSGVKNGAKEALTRNDVAQLALNALKSDMVRIGQYDVVADGKGGFTTKANYWSRDNKAGIDYTVDNDGAVDQDKTLQLIEELYGNTFKLDKNEADDFGRPASKWSKNLDTIGTYASTATATYTKKVTRADMQTLLGTSVIKAIEAGDKTLSYYVDGTVDKDVDSDSDNLVETAAELAKIYAKNDKNAVEGTANGVLTEVYVIDGNVTIVLTNTYLVAVSGDYNTVKEEVRFAAFNDATYPALKAGQNVLSSDDWKGLETLKDGDFLLITVAGGDVASVAAAATVEGTVDTYTQGHTGGVANSITLSGTKYGYSAMSGDEKKVTFTVGQEASLILDTYGYVIGIAETMLNANFLYVLDANKVGGLLGGEVKAVVAYTDGTTETVTLNKVGTVKATGSESGWYTYAKTATGTVNLMAVPAAYSKYTVNQGKTPVTSGMMLVDGEKVNAFTQTAALANNKTVLVVVDADVAATAYVGAKALPTVKASTTVNGKEEYTLDILAKDGYAAYAMLTLTGAANTVSDFDVIDVNAKPEFLFLLDQVNKHYESNGVVYYTYETLKADGTVANVTYDATGAANQYNLIYKAHYNKDGYVTGSTAVGTTTPYFNYVNAAGKDFVVNYNSGALSFYTVDKDATLAKDFIVTNDTQIFLILDGDTGLTKYSGVSYEVNDVKAATVANILDGKKFIGRYVGKTVAANANVLETLYIYVDTVANI